MKQLLIITAAAVLVGAFALIQTACADETQLHLLIISQTQDAQIEVTVGDKTKTEELDAGLNALSYPAASCPDVSVLAFGDDTDLIPIKGNDGDWYAVTMVGAPEVER